MRTTRLCPPRESVACFSARANLHWRAGEGRRTHLYLGPLSCPLWWHVTQSRRQLAGNSRLVLTHAPESPGAAGAGGGHCREPALPWAHSQVLCPGLVRLSLEGPAQSMFFSFRSPAKGSLSLPVGPTGDQWPSLFLVGDTSIRQQCGWQRGARWLVRPELGLHSGAGAGAWRQPPVNPRD